MKRILILSFLALVGIFMHVKDNAMARWIPIEAIYLAIATELELGKSVHGYFGNYIAMALAFEPISISLETITYNELEGKPFHVRNEE